ncbi:MAG: FAD-dependent oxidoreductase [Pirellulales bacterium]
MFKEHVHYHQGQLWFLANDPRVPERVRNVVNRWGLSKDEFTGTGGWPHQMYIREARRLVGAYVMSQANCQAREVVPDSVGMGAYNMDSHNVQRYVDDKGNVRNEGDIQVGVRPYPISYRSILPKREECVNLLVPVCLSASHIAYGSIRMEPVFMVLGHSSAIAASMAIDGDQALHDVDYAKLREKLLADGQVLEYAGGGGKGASIDPKTLKGIVVDNTAAKLTGDWNTSSVTAGYVGVDYLHDNNEGKGEKSAVFIVPLKENRKYAVRVAYTTNGNRAKNVPVTLNFKNAAGAASEKSVVVDQQKKPDQPGFATIAEIDAGPGDLTITIGNAKTDGHVIVDAVQVE